MNKKVSSESAVKYIRRRTSKKYSSEEKICIVLEGSRAECSLLADNPCYLPTTLINNQPASIAADCSHLTPPKKLKIERLKGLVVFQDTLQS